MPTSELPTFWIKEAIFEPRNVKVGFFVEYNKDVVEPEKRGEALMELFKKDDLADFLAKNNFEITLAMTRLDDKTAETIKYLNEKKVPVTAWIVLEDNEGYWTNKTNVDKTKEKTEAVKEWAKVNELRFEGIGFDMENPIQLKSALVQMNLRELYKEFKNYLKTGTNVNEAQRKLGEYIDKLKSENIQTEAYLNPAFARFVLGEKNIGKNVHSIVELDYMSFVPKYLRKHILPFFLRENKTPTLGIYCEEGTFPGRNLTGKPITKEPHLTREELKANIKSIFDFNKKRSSDKQIEKIMIFTLNSFGVAKDVAEILKEL